MKRYRILSLIFGLLAAAVAALTLWVTFGALDAQPVLVTPPAAAAETADAMLAAVCAGDYETAAEMMYGTPDLGMDREPTDEVGRILWDACQESFTYELMGECYATDSGIAQDVKIISMEIPTAVGQLGSRTHKLLNEKMETAEDVSELYDENNEYREDLVMAILEEAVRQALEEDIRYSYRIVTLDLVYAEDRWQVVANQDFLTAVSGGITG